MSASQSHGLEIEKRLRAEFQRYTQQWLPDRLPIETEYTARFDVPGYADPEGRGIPTSIKSAKLRHGNALVCLADAPRIADLVNFPLTRLLVALYEQQGNQKVFHEIREYQVTGPEWDRLLGGVPAEALMAFHQAIRQPDAEQARRTARQWKQHLAQEFPDALIRWNPKIDSKNQRRLQCSVHLKDLEGVIQDLSRVRVYGVPHDPPGVVRPAHLQPLSPQLWHEGLVFPVALDSPPRTWPVAPLASPSRRPKP